MPAICKNLKAFPCKIFAIGLVAGLIAFKAKEPEESWKWLQRCLLQCYNQSAELNMKKWELSVTAEGFFRLKKYFPSGKQEYFSFNISRLKDVSFYGSASSGDIVFQTKDDDVIVQTYNDPAGNIDSMATSLKLPVLNMEPETLDSLRTRLLMFKHQ
jgi:hypothetical protein